MSYVSLCLCPRVPAGVDYPEFSTEQLWGTWPSDCQRREEGGGADLGRFLDLKPPRLNWDQCSPAHDIFINDAVFCFERCGVVREL